MNGNPQFQRVDEIVEQTEEGTYPQFKQSLLIIDQGSECASDRITSYNVCYTKLLRLGHVADKPVLPLGIMAGLDADKGRISLLESAVL